MQDIVFSIKFSMGKRVSVCMASGLCDAISFIDFIIHSHCSRLFVIVRIANNFSVIIITTWIAFPHTRQRHNIRMDVASLASGRCCMFLFCIYMHLHLHLMFIRANVSSVHAWLVCGCVYMLTRKYPGFETKLLRLQ